MSFRYDNKFLHTTIVTIFLMVDLYYPDCIRLQQCGIDLRRAGYRGGLDIALNGRPAKRQRMLFFERWGRGENDYRI